MGLPLQKCKPNSNVQSLLKLKALNAVPTEDVRQKEEESKEIRPSHVLPSKHSRLSILLSIHLPFLICNKEIRKLCKLIFLSNQYV